ncbi:UDP-N-acetylenolpyruvoylglucosamine reductase [Candidatus Saccharibacteria bacterium RIFCSPHIGHO2_12_FULL_47_16b]|nr:MAG: UDP-N-acetylenolpyruvoylglucosamine reductase [Candidatus Saccharibacteria bacterium RIFCSPHIGHO2_12_FULL_47_16b]OGL38721.1 MAG: UDP-N-acetylenolpyruvoylglucosamine reductase [Candidatus Saccharibacteria bacterium RIFCSPLOWO2_02_FULL_46_7]
MDIKENVDLSDYSTMRLGGKARYLAEADSETKIKDLVSWARQRSLLVVMIGEGSNIVWRDEGYEGLIIVNKIDGFKVISKDDKSLALKVGAGEIWDKLVEWSVKKNLTGIEFLSRIPGCVGAAPVQNIGAYGAELSNVLVELEAYDTNLGKFVTLANKDCAFAYRTSRFKTTDKGRFLITLITLRLTKAKPKPPFYESLQAYLDEHKIRDYTPKNIRQAVIEIRKIKLPDPSVVANNGSFFTNPIIISEQFEELKQKYPDIKGWPREDGRVKISAGWMIEQAGFKDVHDQETGMGIWWGSALVMINEHAKTTADLLAFKQKIVSKVYEMFGVMLEQEPELLP